MLEIKKRNAVATALQRHNVAAPLNDVVATLCVCWESAETSSGAYSNDIYRDVLWSLHSTYM